MSRKRSRHRRGEGAVRHGKPHARRSMPKRQKARVQHIPALAQFSCLVGSRPPLRTKKRSMMHQEHLKSLAARAASAKPFSADAAAAYQALGDALDSRAATPHARAAYSRSISATHSVPSSAIPHLPPMPFSEWRSSRDLLVRLPADTTSRNAVNRLSLIHI